MSAKTDNRGNERRKSIDLPPTGPSNPDPLTGATGAHPIEAGIGAAAIGAAAGMTVGVLGGPVGAVIGAAIGGAVAGGYAGKGIGELIDPTTEDDWLREYFLNRTENPFDREQEDFRVPLRYGILASDRYRDRRFDEVEPVLREDWLSSRGESALEWEEARDAARHSYERAENHRLTARSSSQPRTNSNTKSSAA